MDLTRAVILSDFTLHMKAFAFARDKISTSIGFLSSGIIINIEEWLGLIL